MRACTRAPMRPTAAAAKGSGPSPLWGTLRILACFVAGVALARLDVLPGFLFRSGLAGYALTATFGPGLGTPLAGQSAGVVLASFHLDQMLGPLLVRLPGNNARLILLDGGEQVLVDGFAQPASGDHLLNGQQAAHPAARLAALQGKATPAGVVAGLYTVHGEQYRYYASRMSSTDWLLAYVQPEADLLAAYREAKYLGWAQLFFVVLAALLLVAMMQRLVLRPLQALARVQEAMRDGAVPTPVAVRGSGEFAAMAASYNRLVADLSASESRLRTIFEAFPESVIVTRLADGIILDTNDAFLNKIGRSRAEVIGHTGQELGVLPDGNDVMAHRETLLEKGSLERELIHLRTARGEDRWSMYSSRLIDFDDGKLGRAPSDGRLAGRRGISRRGAA